MNKLIIICIVWFLFMLAPILISILAFKKTESKGLFINPSNKKDPRFFVKSFYNIFDKAWETYDGKGNILLSRDEKILEMDKMKKIPKKYNINCDAVIYVEHKDFVCNGMTTFNKEIYAKKDAMLSGTLNIRSIACGENLYIGNNTNIMRWADAKNNVFVGDNCNLGVSTTSLGKINIGENCTFRRLYAKEIIFSKTYNDIKYEEEYELKNILYVENKITYNIKYIDDTNTDEDKIFKGTIVTKHNINISNDCKVHGHIRADKDVRLLDNTVVYGNIFSDGNVYIGKGARVYGHIFSQYDIYIDEGAIIGQSGKIRSVVARNNIFAEENSKIYGYVSAEKGGKSCPNFNLNLMSEENNLERFEKQKIIANASEKILSFSDVAQFKGLLGFRKNTTLEEIEIPDGVEKIPASFFYECYNLKRVILPDSITHIGAFAFYNCINLKEIVFVGKSSLNEIGESAFENCKSLEQFEIPGTTNILNISVFRNCENLKTINFADGNTIENLPTHIFQNCVQLEKVYLPKTIKTVGISAFYNCTSIDFIDRPKEFLFVGEYAFYNCHYLSNYNMV